MENDHKKVYINNAIWLTVLTVAELGILGISLPKAGQVALLLALAATKMVLVGMVYMHLRYETAFLRRVILVPIPLALLFTLSLMYDLPYQWAF
jgi:cytochrome c oxidase subunit IV